METMIKVDESLKKYLGEKEIISLEEAIETLTNKIDDLEYEKMELEEKLENLKQDIQDNYKPIPVNQQVEVYDKDFI